MSTEDVFAIGAISLGAMVGLVATTALLRAPEAAVAVEGGLVAPILIPAPAPGHAPRGGPVDFAIIRYHVGSVDGKLLGGPEGPHSGWEPLHEEPGR
jgi:hypothetical protein